MLESGEGVSSSGTTSEHSQLAPSRDPGAPGSGWLLTARPPSVWVDLCVGRGGGISP